MKLISRYAIVLALVGVFSLAGAAEAGDFVAATSLGIKVSRHHIQQGQKVRIDGRLHSDHHSCVNDEKIKLFAKRRGLGWRQVAHTRTIWNGGYKFIRTPGKTTRFKTQYPGKVTGVHPETHVCLPSTSVVKKVFVTG
jgi:hypothetical protein